VRGHLYGKKTMGTFATLGYTPQDLVVHLANRFEFGMTWENYGREWHIDHVKPMSWFRGPIKTVAPRAFALSNLKPRWATSEIASRHGSDMDGNTNKGNRYAG
jgi:hypothetical protein